MNEPMARMNLSGTNKFMTTSKGFSQVASTGSLIKPKISARNSFVRPIAVIAAVKEKQQPIVKIIKKTNETKMVTSTPNFESNPNKEKPKEDKIERRMSADQIAALLE